MKQQAIKSLLRTLKQLDQERRKRTADLEEAAKVIGKQLPVHDLKRSPQRVGQIRRKWRNGFFETSWSVARRCNADQTSKPLHTKFRQQVFFVSTRPGIRRQNGKYQRVAVEKAQRPVAQSKKGFHHYRDFTGCQLEDLEATLLRTREQNPGGENHGAVGKRFSDCGRVRG